MVAPGIMREGKTSPEEALNSNPEPVQIRNGIYVKKSMAILLGVFFVCAIVGTGLMVHYISPETPVPVDHETDHKPEEHKALLSPLSTAVDPATLRLPTSLIPVHQLVQLQPFITVADNFKFTGYTEITFNCVEATNNVVLHALELNINFNTAKIVLASDPTGSSLTISQTGLDIERQFVVFTTVETLQAGTSYIIMLSFDGILGSNMVGFYQSVYQDENGNDVYLATTQFEATDARRSFPCFDEPALKATFDIQMLRQGTGIRTISNMPRIDTYEDTSGNWPGWYWDIFDTSVPMSSYLVAYVVSDFVNITSNKNDHVEFRVWSRAQAIDQGQYALAVGPDVLTYFEDYFSIPFPLPKQDMVALPDFDAGAMENWGLITYRETALLYDPVLSSATNKQRVGAVIAHELAHQWFGDLVSPSWWSYIWLNEGFASYMENLGLDAVEPTFGMLDQTVLDNVQYVFKTDSLETSHPINFEVNDPVEIDQMFDSISYSKGASIIRMMNFFLTEATFKAGLTNYLNSLAYSAASPDDLWLFLSTQAHQDGTLDPTLTVKQIMDTWTEQMGYPVLTVVRSADGSEVTVTQDRFLMVKNENSNDTHNYMWWVPLTYTSADNPDFTDTFPKLWMSDQQKEIVISGLPTSNWIIFNVQEVGYFRVNYDENSWKAINDQLTSDSNLIDNVNRAQILDDALDLSRAGLLNYTIALDITLYLPNEVDYIPWKGSLDNLDYIEQMFSRTGGYGALKEYLLSLMTPNLYNLVGFADSLTDPHQTQLLRSLTLSWTCRLGYSPCNTNADDLYSQWMATPTDVTIISPNLKSTVYCAGIANGDEAEWNFAWNQYLTSNLGSEKDYLLYAMGCSKQLWILERYLDLAFTEGGAIKKQDAYKVFNAVSGNDYGRDLAWDYLRQEWYTLEAYYGGPSQCASFTYTASREFNTLEKLAEVEEVRAQHAAELGSATQSIDQAIENVQNNINWMDNYYVTIDQWLIDNNFGDGIGPMKKMGKLRHLV